ncbi:MAG: hypothetical protein WBG69_09315 [Arcobacteraceae bacterium]
MTVLTILGLVIGAFILYLSVIKFNEYTQEHFRYLFFEMKSFVAIGISYAFLFFGNIWYQNALKDGGDILNGIILIVIAVIVILALIFRNFYETDFVTGLFGSLFQLSIYVVCTIVGAYVLFVLFALAVQARPVYSIDSRY